MINTGMTTPIAIFAPVESPEVEGANCDVPVGTAETVLVDFEFREVDDAAPPCDAI
jgi:hypothetical protein